MNTSAVLGAGAHGRLDAPGVAAGIGLWVLIGVVSSLFTLFLMAYVMRMDGSDWSPIAMPWPSWLATGLLVAGSAALQRSVQAARDEDAEGARRWLLAGGSCAFAFVLAQLGSWQALQAARVMLAGNPAASFFYLLTALHGLHVLGGLVAWGWTARQPRLDAWRIALCARYWHFLLALWLVLFAALGWLTPEVVRAICGTVLPS